MLELKSVSWKNFMSYGDYTSTIELENLGQVLITGQILDDTADGLRKSNGSGKSTIPNVILWGLFGRTMHSANPGDAVVNHHTGKDCWVKIEFKNGDYIVRTRGRENELVYYKDGEEHILSTNKNQQAYINKQLSLDWEIFTSSAFFTQYGKSWLEMADANRKKALERILHVDRFTHYAASAKKSIDAVNLKISNFSTKITSYESDIQRIKSSVEKQENNKLNYETTKSQRIDSINKAIDSEQQRLNSIILPDIDKIKKNWDIYHQINAKIEEKELSIRQQSNQISTISNELDEISNKIAIWKKKHGRNCLTCLQDIPEDHIAQQIEPLVLKEKDLVDKKQNLSAKKTESQDTVAQAQKKLAERKPTTTVSEANSIINEKSRIEKEILRLQESKQIIENETNPYTEVLNDSLTQIADKQLIIEKIETQKKETELLFKHYTYIYKAYSERNKIKSYVFKEHIPFINKRLNHYLDILNLDIRVNLTDNLGLSSNTWGYDFQSGGERKRTDLAFMLAAFDFHETMYGRQCNILVLDEVDGRMDDDGIDGLINIIKQELAGKVETIMIISHRNQMHDVFDKEIKVVKSDGYSTIRL